MSGAKGGWASASPSEGLLVQRQAPATEREPLAGLAPVLVGVEPRTAHAVRVAAPPKQVLVLRRKTERRSNAIKPGVVPVPKRS
jgi:hypothetical protein